MLGVGWEITALQKGQSALLLVIHQPQVNARRMKLGVIMVPLKVVGWVITVCQKDLSVPLCVTVLLDLCANLMKWFVTWDIMMDVGWEITVCQKVQSAHQIHEQFKF